MQAAPRGAEDGTIYWTDRADRLELAVVLEPEAPADRTLEAVYVLTVAVGDALAGLVPPALPVAYAWPGDLLLDGARVGGVRVALAPVAGAGAVPPWLVRGLTISVGPLADDPGRLPELTSLHGEGAGDVTVVAMVEAVTRHLLRWTNHWLEDGFVPVQSAWNRRCFRRGEVGQLTLGDRQLEGPVAGLDAAGALVVGEHRADLHQALGMLS